MKLSEAIQASDYVTACAEMGELEVIVSADGIGSYTAEEWDSMGNSYRSVDQRPLDEVQRHYPTLNWWPMREAGEWGTEAEEQRHHA